MAGLMSTVVGIISLALAMMQVRWTDHARSSVTVVAATRQEEILECLNEGLEARLRFEARLCYRRSIWLDGCEDARSELHTVRFDEITESYRVVSDRLQDDAEPTAVGAPARSEALRLVSTLNDMPLEFLARERPDLLSAPESYIQVRTIFVCRGSVNRTLAHLSRVITLGLVNAVEDRSSWSDFKLTAPAPLSGGDER